MKTRTGGYKNGVANSAKYLLKTKPEGDAIDCSIERFEGESDYDYAQRIERVFESARVPNQKNLYQFTALALHPSEGHKYTDAQMIAMAKEVYLQNGVKNSLNDNRHYMFVVERNTDHHHVHAMIHLTDLTTNRVNNKMIDYNPIIEKIENKYGLYNEHRKPDPLDKSPDLNKDKKKEFKKDLSTILENSLSPSEFLQGVKNAGYVITHNGNTAFSLSKNDQTYKASDLGLSYKSLKARLGDDQSFSMALAALHEKLPKIDSWGTIGVNRNRLSDESKPFSKKSTLHTRFTSVIVSDHEDYFFNDSSKKAFEYCRSKGKVSFQNSSAMSLKAGIQRLIEDMNTPGPLYFTGSENFKKNAWLQFHMMNLADKGYEFKGYKPNGQDEEKLRQMREEQDKRFAKKAEVTSVFAQQFNAKSTETQQTIKAENFVGKPAVVDNNESKNEEKKAKAEKNFEMTRSDDDQNTEKKKTTQISKNKTDRPKKTNPLKGMSEFTDWLMKLAGLDEESEEENSRRNFSFTSEATERLLSSLTAYYTKYSKNSEDEIMRTAFDEQRYVENKKVLEKYGHDGYEKIEDEIKLYENVKALKLADDNGVAIDNAALLNAIDGLQLPDTGVDLDLGVENMQIKFKFF